MIAVGKIVRRSLCPGCRQMKPSAEMYHQHAGKLYCSAGCLAKARWQMLPAPRLSS